MRRAEGGSVCAGEIRVLNESNRTLLIIAGLETLISLSLIIGVLFAQPHLDDDKNKFIEVTPILV